MKLAAKTDIEAPLSFVYATLVDHASWEREAVRRGVEIDRPADMPLTGVGAGWRIRAPFRGKMRMLLIRIDAMTLDEKLGLTINSPSVDGESQIEVLALSPRRTRLRVSVTVKPKTLAARLFINTLRLAKGRVQSRFDARTGQFGAKIEERYQRSKAQPARV